METIEILKSEYLDDCNSKFLKAKRGTKILKKKKITVMAYIPPHKRQPKGGATSSPPSPAPPPDSVIPRFKRNLNLMPKKRTKKIYAENSISKWFVVGLADESRVSGLTRLEPAAMESFEQKSFGKPFALVLKENGEDANQFLENPWDFVAETVKQDLFSSFQKVKDEMKGCEFVEIKPTLVLRFGRVLFHGNRSFTAESMVGSSPSIGNLEQMRRSFYTNVPPSFVEHITSNVVPQFDFKCEKRELYQVKLSDNTRPDSTISCKCTVAKDTNQLELFKAELNQVRNMVADMSCLDKNLDLRLMLCTKRILVALTDEELENIKTLINSARLDSEVKGGLSWPLGKQSSGSGDRYTVIGVWHTNSETFTNSSMRLKVRRADRFDFRSSSGEVAKEVRLTMPGIVSLLPDQTVNTEIAFEMLKENLKLIWKHFLLYDSFTGK